MEERGLIGGFSPFWAMLLLIISELVEPGEHACIAFPGWFAARCGRSGDLFQGFPLRFQIGPGIVVGCIEAHMAEPAAYDCNVDARRVSTAEQKSAIRRRKTRPSCYMPGGVA